MSLKSARVQWHLLVGISTIAPLVASAQIVSHEEFCKIYAIHAVTHYDSVHKAWSRNPKERDDAAAAKFWQVHETAKACEYVPPLATQMRLMGYERPASITPFIVSIPVPSDPHLRRSWSGGTGAVFRRGDDLRLR